MSSEVTPQTPWMKEAAQTLSWVTTAALGKPVGDIIKDKPCAWVPLVVAGGITVTFALNYLELGPVRPIMSVLYLWCPRCRCTERCS